MEQRDHEGRRSRGDGVREAASAPAVPALSLLRVRFATEELLKFIWCIEK